MSKIQLLFVDESGEAIGHTEVFEENMSWIVPKNAHVIRVRFIGPMTPKFDYPENMILGPDGVMYGPVTIANPPGSGWDTPHEDRPTS